MKKVINISIEEDLYEQLRIAAYDKHFSLSAVINSALNDFNEKLKRNELNNKMSLDIELKIYKRTRKGKK
ncbi:hypothetical protein N0575_27540 [Pseudomonas aeruginosa]|nr:hypothetical protein [Pseudomonas aeruginosa]MCT1213484.1 hypothetical protein [Pseudomonas aeruginosa]